MKQKKKITKKNRTVLTAIAVTIVLLIGLSLMLYPTVAEYVNSLGYKKDIENYRQEVQKLDDSERQAILAAARDYNRRLLANSTSIAALDESQKDEYFSLLNPYENGMMGYIEIKKLSIYLPIYHGVDENVLQVGIGHIEGSSLPVGGKGTHSILSGHTGLPSNKLFSSIDQLKIGDTFILNILGEVLTYQVQSTVVLLPEEAEKQDIDPNKDYCTLMTCTPYGVNSHRLLVKGVRIETPQTADKPNVETLPADEPIPAPVPPVLWVVAIVLAALFIAAIVTAVWKRRKPSKRRNGGSDET